MTRSLQLYLKEIYSYPLLSTQEEKELARKKNKRCKATRKEAKERLICCNLRLVISIAKKFIGRGLEFDDLIQAGNEGLMAGVKKYDGRTGNRFSTYASWWILVYIQKALMKNEATKIPFYLNAQISKVVMAKKQLNVGSGFAHTSEIARVTGMPREKVEEIERIIRAKRSISLNQEINENGEELINFLPDKKDWQPEKVIDLKMGINRALGRLTRKEARVLCWRTDYNPANPEGDKYYFKKYKEISGELGVTDKRCEQIHKKTLEKIKTSKKFKILRELYDAY